jgi:hypothetical protein
MSSQIDLVLFDFDGTLAETEFMSVSAISRFLAERGISASPTEVANITSGVGRIFVPSLLERHFALEFDDTTKGSIDEAIVTALQGDIAVTNGTAVLLAALAVPHCIASNAPRAELVGRMRRAGLLRQFGPRFFSSDDTRVRKPAPDLFLLASVSAIRSFECGPHMGEQHHVLPLPVTGRPIFPGVEPARADPEHLAHAADGELCLLRVDEQELHRLPSLTKKAVARLRMSRSCRRTSFSRRSRFNSAATSSEPGLGGSSINRSRLRPIQRR